MPSLRRPADVVETRVYVARAALAEMLAEAHRMAPSETGGMLLGYVAPDGPPEHIMVESVIGPGPDAQHRPQRFEPDSEWQERELARRYAASGRITTYLGDWHTHPKGAPTPSGRDRKTARAIARSKTARMAKPLMLILGCSAAGEWALLTHRWQTSRLAAVETEFI